MASQGPLGPGTSADDATVGSVVWLNPTNANAEDAVYADASVTAVNTPSHYLKSTNFGFTIPAGATILGILVEYKRHALASTTSIKDHGLRIVKGGVIGATDRADVSTFWTTSLVTFFSYGSASDLWGETWSSTDINASTFGVALSVSGFSPDDALVDFVRITVTYTASSGFIARQRRHNAPALHAPPVVVLLHSHPRRHPISKSIVESAGELRRHRSPPALHAPVPALVTPSSHPRRRGATKQPPPLTLRTYLRRGARRAPPLPPGRGKASHRGRPFLGAPFRVSRDHKGRRGTALRPPPAERGRRRRGRVISYDSIIGPLAARHRLTRLPRVLPPVAGRKRRGRLPGPGTQTSLSLRRRGLRLLRGPPFGVGRRRRPRVAVAVAFGPISRRHPVRLPKMRPPEQGRRRRGRLFDTGIGAPPPPRRRTLRRLATLPVTRGGRRRGRVPALSVSVLARRRQRRTAVLPGNLLRGKKRRAAAIGLTVVGLVKKRRRRQQTMLPASGKNRRGKTYRTGQFNQAVLVRQRKRAYPWSLVPTCFYRTARAFSLLSRRRRGALRDPFVAGPYQMVAGQVFVAGAVAGDLQSE